MHTEGAEQGKVAVDESMTSPSGRPPSGLQAILISTKDWDFVTLDSA